MSGQQSAVACPVRIRRAFLVVTLTGILGLFLAVELAPDTRPTPGVSNIFFVLFTRYEPLHLWILTAWSLISSIVLLSARLQFPPLPTPPRFRRAAQICPAAITRCSAAVVLAVTAVGATVVMHDFPLSMDEFNADFQARIFAAGQVRAPVDKGWSQFVGALTPQFVVFHDQTQTWAAGYLPVYSAIRALFVRADLGLLTNPLLAAASILILGAVAARLWRDDRETQIVAVLVLASSPQFLLTAMTAYSMPAHLCLNLLWFWLYLRSSRLSLGLAPWVGAMAMGLHQLNVHALFVFPFFVRLALTRRWQLLGYFTFVYASAGALWLGWMLQNYPDATGAASAFISPPGPGRLIIQSLHLIVLISWQSLPMIVLLIIAILRWRALPPVARDLVAGVLLTFCFYAFYNVDQGHGWGYRYAHGVLGNIAILAAYGWKPFRDSLGHTKSYRFVAWSLVLSCLIQLPIRSVQAESVVRPFWQAAMRIRTLPVDVVVVDAHEAWYARDQVRNDPWLRNTPKIMLADRLKPEDLKQLADRGSIVTLRAPELSQLGLQTGDK